MEQGRSRFTAEDHDADERRARWQRRLLRLLKILVLVWLGIKALFAAPGSLWIWSLGAYLIAWALSPLVLRWLNGRRRSSWRRDGVLFEPSLPRPVSDVPEEQEWTLPFHPLIRLPLALVLIGLLYWVLVLHQMQLPGHWLITTLVVAIINLWSWREPLILVGLVGAGVAVMAALGWFFHSLSPEGLAAVMILVPVVIVIALAELRKRKSGRRQA